MKEAIRSFSLGLFTAGIIIIVAFFVDHDENKAVDLPIDEMITKMKDEGYRVITESEYITMSVNTDISNKENNETKKQEKEAAKKDKAEKASSTEQTDKQETEETNKKQDKAKAKEKEKEEEKEEKTVIKYTLQIESGMPSSVIGDLLEQNKIVKDGNELNKYLEKEGYSLRVQLGKFDITSDMSFYQIAEKITR